MRNRYEMLLSPFKIGNVVFRNRLFTAPMGLHALQGGELYPTDAIITHYANKAKGGAADKVASESLAGYFSRREEADKSKTEAAAELKPGDRVRQKKFGEGTVVSVEQKKRDLEVTVDFDRCGRKVLLAGYAGFTKL